MKIIFMKYVLAAIGFVFVFYSGYRFGKQEGKPKPSPSKEVNFSNLILRVYKTQQGERFDIMDKTKDFKWTRAASFNGVDIEDYITKDGYTWVKPTENELPCN